jgi:hypothetical protein
MEIRRLEYRLDPLRAAIDIFPSIREKSSHLYKAMRNSWDQRNLHMVFLVELALRLFETKILTFMEKV